ncbi:MAG: histidine kinase [Treponema sp.]|nr:histidine kinase [Treponema sp.]
MKLSSFIANRSLRWRIMTCVSLALALMSIVFYVSLKINTSSIETLGDSYNSNSQLDSLTQYITATEKAMENYVNYHTFESIDNYYASRQKILTAIENMNINPSKNEVLQKEYIVYQICNSFVNYSGTAVAARRGNNQKEIEAYYIKTVECYNMLLSQLLELNKLQLTQNADEYQQNKDTLVFATKLSFFLLVMLSILIFLFLYLSITRITKPLMDISNVATRVSKRDFNIPLFNKTSKDEIGNICQAFDRMIISIREYIDTIWDKARTEAELKEKEIEMKALYTDAQLKALQNQINPHFLFNTLNTGAQLAMMESADKTCYFIEQVADFFRYNIQQQKQTATIDEELGLVDNFVYIMKVRFGNRLEFTKNIPERKFEELIPVMTLQPLVENCIKHGLENQKGKVELNITLDDKYITISISDNGSGIPDEIKNKVFEAVKNNEVMLPKEILPTQSQDSQKNNGTGLINVFLRLKLYFHKNNIFDITKGEDGNGTTFIIRIPCNV